MPTPTTLVERLVVNVPFEEFAAAVRPAIERLEREGVPGLHSINFWRAPDPREVGVVIEFSDSDQIIAHMEMVSGMAEFRAFSQMITLVEMRVHGELPAGAEAWVRQFGDGLVHYAERITGFHR